ncbi:MAG TPA: beta-eliminating lyase-related protein [Rhizomicrobium sp.]
MNFASDNAYGAAPEMLEALAAASAGTAASYGEDWWTGRLQTEMSRVFERPVAAYPVITGTAANALALATIVPAHGAIFCHRESHIITDECGAPEFFTHGAKVVPIEAHNGRLAPDAIEESLSQFVEGSVHHPQPAAVSIAQASEMGLCYTTGEIGAISSLAKPRRLKLHMDGARLANAVAHLGCTPAEATWRAGVDVLSFGATKNGALGAEAVVFFTAEDARDFEYRRKKSGHLLSKMRFVSAQLLCALEQNRWLAWAARANALAARLARGLAEIRSIEVAYPIEANLIFAFMPDAMAARLRAEGANFGDWAPSRGGRTLVRLVTSFMTPESDIERLIAIARG